MANKNDLLHYGLALLGKGRSVQGIIERQDVSLQDLVAHLAIPRHCRHQRFKRFVRQDRWGCLQPSIPASVCSGKVAALSLWILPSPAGSDGLVRLSPCWKAHLAIVKHRNVALEVFGILVCCAHPARFNLVRKEIGDLPLQDCSR